MNALSELMADNARKVMSRFFLRIGRKAREAWRDEYTGQLFGIAEYLRCEGLLAKDAAPRASPNLPARCREGWPDTSAETGVKGRSLDAPGPAAAAYLARCERVIAEAARELAA